MGKKKEVNRNNVVAHIIGGMSVGFMMACNNNRFSGGADTRLKDKILKHNVKFQKQLSKEQLQAIAQIAHDTILETFSDKGLNPHTFVESIFFDFEKEVTGFYDGDIMDVVCRFSAKNELPVADSYNYAERIKKVVRKKIFDNIGDII